MAPECKQKDLSSNPSTQVNNPGLAMCVIPVLCVWGGKDRGSLGLSDRAGH